MPILEVLSFEICRMYPERFLRHILKMVSKKICFGAFLNLIPQYNSAHASVAPAKWSEGPEHRFHWAEHPYVLICPGQSRFTPFVLTKLLVVPPFTLKGILVWVINNVVTVPICYAGAPCTCSPCLYIDNSLFSAWVLSSSVLSSRASAGNHFLEWIVLFSVFQPPPCLYLYTAAFPSAS